MAGEAHTNPEASDPKASVLDLLLVRATGQGTLPHSASVSSTIRWG